MPEVLRVRGYYQKKLLKSAVGGEGSSSNHHIANLSVV